MILEQSPAIILLDKQNEFSECFFPKIHGKITANPWENPCFYEENLRFLGFSHGFSIIFLMLHRFSHGFPILQHRVPGNAPPAAFPSSPSGTCRWRSRRWYGSITGIGDVEGFFCEMVVIILSKYKISMGLIIEI